MNKERKHQTALITMIGGIILAVILIGGTMLMGQHAQRDTAEAVRSVSMLYLDELAGRREQVVEDNLKDNINVIRIAIGMITEEDLSGLDHMRPGVYGGRGRPGRDRPIFLRPCHAFRA